MALIRSKGLGPDAACAYMQGMNRRSFLAATLLALAAVPAEAKLSLSEINRYLDTFKTAQGGFVQANPDGTLSQGKFYLSKPGRIRFEYEPPNKALVLSNGDFVGVFDEKSNRPPNRYPLSRTPLELLLRNSINLSTPGMVVGHSGDATQTRVTVVDPQNPKNGSLTVVLTHDPTELRQWVVKDRKGAETTVILNDIRKGGSYPNNLFDITAEELRRGF